MAYKQYTIDFKTLHKDELLQVAIFGAANITPSALYGAATPIVTEEDNDPDIFMPVRPQTGYINIVDTGQTQDGYSFDWHTLLPSEAMDRPVVLRNSAGTVYWKGFIQSQQPESTIYEEPVERSYAIYDVLGALEFVDFNIGINSPNTNAYVNFAYLINRIIQTLPVEVRPNTLYFQGGTQSKNHLLCKVNPMLFCDVSDEVEAGEMGDVGYQQNISDLRTKYTCREVLEEVCKFWGWSCRTYEGNLYFMRDVAPLLYRGQDHAPFYVVSASGLATLAAGGTNVGSVDDNPSSYTYNGTEVISTENNLSNNKPLGYVSVKSNVGAFKELIKLFPDRPRTALALVPNWNGGDTLPQLRISQTFASDYYVDSHEYHATVATNYPGNIFGLRTDAEKWGTGGQYTYTYMAGAMFGTGSVQRLQLISRWPFNYQDCRLSMKATFFKQDGTEVTETHDDKDTYGNIGKGTASMVMIFYAANGYTYYWNGDRWTTGEDSFLSYVGGSDGYIYPQSKAQKIPGTGYSRPRKYITFESLGVPVGRLEIRITSLLLNTGNNTGGIADMTVEVERTPLPSVNDSVQEEHTYVPANGPRRSLPLQDEWNEDTIFASDDVNQFGIGTVLKADNTPLQKVTIDDSNSDSAHPEAWTAAMVYGFGRTPRQVLCTEMNRAALQVANITPRRHMTYLGGDWFPFAICHYWRDDIKKIYAISVSRGTATVIIIVKAGTGIASVSPAGENTVYVGSGLYMSCVPQTSPTRYVFSHWQNSAGTVISRQQGFTLTNITAGDTITAVATPDNTKYTVIIISNAAGVTSVSGAGTYKVGTRVTISCVYDTSNYNFVAWTENNAQGAVISESNSFQLTVDRDITLYPQTEPEGGDSWFMYFAVVQPAWGYIRDDNGRILHDGDWDEFIDGEIRGYTAVPASGYEFVKWLFNGEDFSGNTNQEIPWYCDQSTDPDSILTAVFQEKTPEPEPTTYTLHLYCPVKGVRVYYTVNGTLNHVDFTQNGEEHAIEVPMNATVLLSAEYRGYDVATWHYWYDYANGVILSRDSSEYSFTMNGEKYISASYS